MLLWRMLSGLRIICANNPKIRKGDPWTARRGWAWAWVSGAKEGAKEGAEGAGHGGHGSHVSSMFSEMRLGNAWNIYLISELGMTW